MESEQATLPGMVLTEESRSPGEGAASSPENKGNGTRKPRFKIINRQQVTFRVVDVERLIPEDHPARAIWEFVGGLDLSGYDETVRALEGVAGRSPFSPQLLISLWIYAYSQGVKSARAMERLCGGGCGLSMDDGDGGRKRSHAIGFSSGT